MYIYIYTYIYIYIYIYIYAHIYYALLSLYYYCSIVVSVYHLNTSVIIVLLTLRPPQEMTEAFRQTSTEPGAKRSELLGKHISLASRRVASRRDVPRRTAMCNIYAMPCDVRARTCAKRHAYTRIDIISKRAE